MKGDFTRFTFRPDKHYTGVYMQQGRLQLDSDWNEQVAIQNYRLQKQLYDVIGLEGIPDTEGNQHAFEIRPNGDDFTIAPGRIYVDGILCQLENSITYKTQPDYPNATVDDNLTDQSKFYLVYLDVWERHITAIEDPEIREVALNGLDTTTRTKTIVQVKLLPLPSYQASGNDSKDKATVEQKWCDFLREQQVNRELSASKVDSTTISDNHLYRIEIHTPGTSAQATFKWSRDNGNVVSAIETIKDDVITISQKNSELWQSSQPDQWIEIIDDSHELAGKPGTLTCLKQAFDNQLIFDKTRIIGNALSEYKNPGLKVRRWDYTSDTITAGIPIKSNSSDGWIVLGQKEGIKVKFQAPNDSTQPWRTGDYWLIPTRAATNDIDWHGQSSPPPDTGNSTTETEFAKPREGIYHHYCKLAVLKYEGSSGSKVFKVTNEFQKDIVFSPLTKYLGVKGNIGISEDKQSAALHVQSSESKKLNDLGSISPHNSQDPDDSFIDLSSISLQEPLHPGDLMTIPTRDSNKATVLITNVPDAQTLKVFPPIGSRLQGEVAAKEVVYQQPIARFDSNGKTHVIVTANGHFGVGTEAPTASLTVQGDSDQQPIACFADSTGNTRVTVTGKGNLEVGTASLNAKLEVKGTTTTDRLDVKGTATTDRLIARGFVKTDKLITREFEAKTFRGNCFKLQPLQPNPAEPDFGFIQAQASGGKKEIQFVASKDVNFAFLNGNVKITPPSDAPSISENPAALGTAPREPEAALTVEGKIKAASLQLGDSTTITGFSDDFSTAGNQGIVLTGIAIRDGLQNKANVNGVLDQFFQTQNLTVNGALKFAGKEIEITEFSNDFTLSKERAEKAIPTLDSVRGYVDGQLGNKANKAGQETEDFKAKNLGVHGNLTVSGTTTIGTEEDLTTEKLSIKGTTTTKFLTVGDRLRNNNGSKETVLQVEGVANFTNDIRYKGSILQESSRQLKEDITEISSQEISELLKNLNPIKFRYISDQTKRVHIGFLSEEAPEAVASPDRQAVSISDILGILVQAVKEQRQATKILADVVDSQKIEISKLQAQVKELEEKKTHRFW